MAIRVVLLFGGSSAGKTAVAEALVRRLPGLWLIAGVDIFWSFVPAHLHEDAEWLRRESQEMDRVTRGWHRAIAAIAREGNNVIVDELLLNRSWFDDWEQALAGLRYLAVWLRSSAATVEEREASRGDRPAGLALADHLAAELVAASGAQFDMVIDSDDKEPDQRAAEIQRLIEERKTRS